MGSVADSRFRESTQQETKPRTSVEGVKLEVGEGVVMVDRAERYCLMLNAMMLFMSSSFVSQSVFSNV